MTLLQGREIGLEDAPGTPKSPWSTKLSGARISRARTRSGNHFDIGKPKNTGEYEIVGVLRDAQFHDAKEKIKPIVFPAIMQDTSQTALSSGIIIRTVSAPASMAAAVRQAIADVDPNLP